MSRVKPTPDQLRAVPVFADLEDSELDWLAEHGVYREYGPGESVVEQGTPADRMVVVLEGRFEFRFPNRPDPLMIEAGAVTGLLPFSRMTHFVGNGRVLEPLKTLTVYKQHFMPMLNEVPALGPRLVAMLTDRVRNFSQQELRQEKLASLGKLSAGLAHELNNPASAATRAAATLAEGMAELETLSASVGARIGPGGMAALVAYQARLRPRPLTTLERADLEEELGGWLEAHDAEKAWEWAATWADAGASVAWLEGLHTLKRELAAEEAMPDGGVAHSAIAAGPLPEGGVAHSAIAAGPLPEVLAWLEASLRMRAQVRVVQDSAERISGLVKSIKSYSYMDQMPKQTLDVREGLDSTLALFDYRLRKGVRLRRDYSPDIPKIEGFGSELNQVWTNLIDNALDAMGESGTLTVRAGAEGESVVVEVADTGPGIPPADLGKIFDPFFTTKEVGKGTGLGLETVRRIVEHHGGSVGVESEPGDTRFTVRLPLPAPGQGG